MRVLDLGDAVSAETRALNALVRNLSGAQLTRKVDEQRTVKDVLGHVAAYLGVERQALAAGVGRSGETPVYFDDYKTWNEEQYQLRKSRQAPRILAELQENSARYLSLVKSLYNEDLLKQIRFPWNQQGSVHELITEGLAHHREHREELEAALSRAE